MTQPSGKYPTLATIRGLFKRRVDVPNNEKPIAPIAVERDLGNNPDESFNLVSASFNKRVEEFRTCLAGPKVSLAELQNLCFDGIPDNHKLKAECWKLLLGYLPLVRADQEAHLKKQRDLYAKFLSDLFLRANDLSKRTPRAVREAAKKEPTEQTSENWCEDDNLNNSAEKKEEIRLEIAGAKTEQKTETETQTEEITLTTISADDDPLCADEEVHNDWKRYFEDEEIRAEIEKDITRTHQSLMFFHKEVPKDSMSLTYQWNRPERKHSDILTRILMVFAKLNPGIKYVQGMNEILSPIYYVFSTDSTDKQWAEADSFYCFMNLMSHLNDRFVSDSDTSQIGIIACINELDDILKDEDVELWKCLQEQNLDPRYYALRYLSLLLSMEFELPDVLRLWDSFLGDPMRFKFVTYFVVGMLKFARNDLMKNCFSDNLMLLQQYPYENDILQIFNIAVEIQTRRHPHLFAGFASRKSYSFSGSPLKPLGGRTASRALPYGVRSPPPNHPAPKNRKAKRARSTSDNSNNSTFWRNWATRLKFTNPSAPKKTSADDEEFKVDHEVHGRAEMESSSQACLPLGKSNSAPSVPKNGSSQ